MCYTCQTMYLFYGNFRCKKIPLLVLKYQVIFLVYILDEVFLMYLNLHLLQFLFTLKKILVESRMK